MSTVQLTPGAAGSPGWMRVLHWAPRVIGILFVLFLGIFALDAFGPGQSLWESIGAFLMHLLPNFALLLVLILAWRWPWVGAVAFIGFGVWYIITSWGRFDWTAPALIGGLPILVGLLFLADWWVRRTRQA